MRTNLSLHDGQRRIVELYSTARSMQMDHTRFQKLRKPLIDEINSRTEGGRFRYTRDFRSFLAGYEAAKREQFWADNFYYVHCYKGEFYSDDTRRAPRMLSFKMLQKIIDEDGARIAAVPACHMWVGTERPFTEWKTV